MKMLLGQRSVSIFCPLFICYLTFSTRYLNPYYLYPVAVIVMHTLLLTLSWTFFSITINNPVPLSPRMAVKARDHIQSVTMVVTLLASFISVIAGV